MSHLRSNLVAYLALFIALGGTAYAATAIEKNAVRSKQIKNGQVKNKDLAKSAVTAPKVENGSLLSEDFASGQLPPGPPGPAGQAGNDATNLFAFIEDEGGASTAVVGYGSGVTAVTDVAGPSSYVVTFGRNLDNCVVHASAGFGQPPISGALVVSAFPSINMSVGTDQEAGVSFETDAGNPTDTSFLISAFC